MFKKALILVVALTIVASFAAMVGARVEGTPHDLAPEPCAMCHTPHNAVQYPLWNRLQDTQTYDMYTSSTYDMDEGNTGPNPPSALCLQCHNGVNSTLSNYPGPCSVPDPLYDYNMPDNACGLIGSGDIGGAHDLTNDHPISFTYDETLDVNNDGFTPAITIGTQSFIQGVYTGTLYPLAGYATVGIDQFECTTCHSVHDTATYDGKGSTQVYFLWTDNYGNNGSVMCMDCHANR